MGLLSMLTEQITNIENNLVLYHGSDDTERIKEFHENQFFTINEGLAQSYAENQGGYVYEVKVRRLKPLFLKGYYVRLGGKKNMKTEEPEQYELEYNLLKNYYGDESLKHGFQHGFNPSPVYVFDGDYLPAIKYAKKHNYDSLKFYDESFDAQGKALTYIIFDPKKIEITKIIKEFDLI